MGTVKANPFTADGTTGLWSFYADNARYDVQLSGGGIAAPFTLADFLLDDSAQTVTTIVVVASSATPVFDVGKASILTNILTANVTSSTITNGVTGQVITIYLAQDGTGGWTFTWPVDVQLRAGGFVVSDDANAVSVIGLYFDGTNWREIGVDADEVGRTLVPVVTGGDLGSLTARWGAFLQTLDISSTITGDLVPLVAAQDIGTSGARWDAFLADLDVTQLISDIIPSITARDIGTAALRWVEFLEAADIKILNDSYYNVKSYGAVGDGVADDTTAIQAAIDAADAAIFASQREANAGFPTVLFPAGEYRITAAIDPKRVNLLGVGPANGSRIMWDGAVGATVFTFTNGLGFRKISNLSFIDYDGVDLPAIWFLFSGDTPDALLEMEYLQFVSSTSDAIRLASGWINFHIREIRWDGIGGWAINSIAPSAQNQSSWSLDSFTYALNDGTLAGNPPGIFRFANPFGSSNVSTVQISNARIEAGGATADFSLNKAVIEFDGEGVGGSGWIALELSNVTIQMLAGIANTTLLHTFNSVATNGVMSFILDNVKLAGLANLIAGEWNGWAFPISGGEQYSSFIFNADGSGDFIFASKPIELVGFSNAIEVLEVRERADGGYRLRIGTRGLHNWGPGDGTTDTCLGRGGPNNLRLCSGDDFNPQDATGMALGLPGFRWDLQGRNVDLTGTLKIGAGTAITRHLSGTASLDFTALAANTCEVLTVPVTSATDGDTVTLGIPNALADVDGGTERTLFFGWVSAGGTVSVRRCNVTGTVTAEPAAATVRADVLQH